MSGFTESNKFVTKGDALLCLALTIPIPTSPWFPAPVRALNKFKMEAAQEVGVNLKQGYNGDLTSREAGSVGGQMVKKMIQAYENSMQ